MNASQFPLLAAAVKASKSTWGQKSLDKVIAILNTYTDSIPNPEFKNAKDALNTVVDIARDIRGTYEEAFTAAYRFQIGLDYTQTLDFMYANNVAGKVKLATKKKFDNAQWFAVCAEIVVLNDALTALKSKIVKRQGRSEEEKAENYVPPMPTTAAAIRCNEILKAMTDGLTLQYADYLHNDFVTSVETFVPATRAEVLAGRRYPSFTETILMPLVGEDWDTFNMCYKSLNADWKAILRSRAEREADFAQRMFLYKNVTKLAVIVEAKGVEGMTYQILDGRINSAGFQGEIKFSFVDGSSFVVRNSVKVNYSVHNKPFHQFPTTFHNVMMSNGTTKKSQSQEEMIEEFAGEK